MTFVSLKWADADHTAIIAERADGSVRVIEALFDGDLWAEAISGTFGAVTAFVPPQVILSRSDIDRERDRRVQEGVVVTLAGYGDVSLQGRDIDMRNLHGLATAAQLRIAGGASATLTPFRDKANAIHQLTQPQILELWSQGAAFVSAVFQAAWALKDNLPIPADFADDAHWP